MESLEAKIVRLIMEELRDRGAIGDALDSVDDETLTELNTTLVQKVEEVLRD